MNSYLIFFYIVATIVAVSATDYCAMNCTVDGKEIKHSACGYDGLRAKNCTKTFEVMTISEDLKQVILDAHNSNRNRVAAGNSSLNFRPACRMASIQYNDELAELAAIWANQCREDADICHPTDSFPNSSQLKIKSLREPYRKATDMTKFLIDYAFEENLKIKNIETSSMLFDRNTHIGCTITTETFPNPFGENYEFTEWFVICNYSDKIDKTAPAKSTPWYDECKKAGELCKTDRNDKYPNLCSEQEIY